MTGQPLREQLHHQIDTMPEDVLAEVADFTAFVLDRRQNGGEHRDWSDSAWRSFAAEQFLRGTEDEDVEYTLDDAREVFHP